MSGGDLPNRALLGQGDDWRALLDAARTRRVPHAFLIEGGLGTGKSLAARELAAALLSGGDHSAAKRVHSGNHPDLHLLVLPEDRTEIPVETVRELLDTLAHRPLEGGARVAIVDPADRLNEQGQNALLKTLEEPGEDAFLILVARRPEALLETVRSRSRRLRIRPLDDATLRTHLSPPGDASPNDVRLAVAGAGGSLGLARRLLDPSLRELAAAVDRFLLEPTPAAVHPAASSLLGGGGGRSDQEGRARDVLLLLRARLWAAVQEQLAGAGDAGYLPPRAERCLTALDAVLAADLDLDLGVPVTQTLEGLLLRLVGVLAIGPHPA
ncbi:MAG: DUF2075 domain-containing protein [Planctomycetes bacterium]|nr:DUF2075 domain-containing protein [Planctomycetota bacterium]